MVIGDEIKRMDFTYITTGEFQYSVGFYLIIPFRLLPFAY